MTAPLPALNLVAAPGQRRAPRRGRSLRCLTTPHPELLAGLSVLTGRTDAGRRKLWVYAGGGCLYIEGGKPVASQTQQKISYPKSGSWLGLCAVGVGCDNRGLRFRRG